MSKVYAKSHNTLQPNETEMSPVVAENVQDYGIDTRTFTRPKKSNRQNAAASKPSSESPSEVTKYDVRRNANVLEQPDDESQLFNSFEINSRTFTRTSPRCRKSQLAAEAAELRSSSNSSAASDADERVRCNGGESMVDCAANVYWPCDDAGKAHNSRVRDDYLPDMVNMHIIAKARLQEKDLRQKCSQQPHGAIINGDVQQLRGYLNIRKMSSPAVVSSALCNDDSESSYSDDRLSPLSFASVLSHHAGRLQPASRASFSTLDQLPLGPSTPLKKSLSSTPKSCIPRPSSASKLPVQRNKNHSSNARRSLATSYQPHSSSWREGCF